MPEPQIYDPFDEQPDNGSDQFDDEETESTLYWEELDRMESMSNPYIL